MHSPPVRVRRNAPVIDTPTARRHTQVPPYIPARTADMARRAGPMCPAAGTGSPECTGHRHPHRTDCPAWFAGRIRYRTPCDKAAVRHPLTGWGRRPSALPGIAPSADGALGRLGCFAGCGQRVFRPLRRAGVSPAAAGDQRPCLWTPRFFEKNRVKLLSLGAVELSMLRPNKSSYRPSYRSRRRSRPPSPDGAACSGT